MRAIAVAAGVVVLSLVGASRADKPSAVPQDGFWKAQSVQFDGKEQCADPKTREPLTLVTSKNEYKVYYVTDAKTGDAFRLFTSEFKPDSANGTFAMEIKDGQKKGTKVHGIFQTEGGVLKLCYGPSDKPRPNNYVTTPGSGLFCETWSYMNPQPKAPPASN